MKKKSYVQMLKECLGFLNIKKIERNSNGWYILEEYTIMRRNSEHIETVEHFYRRNTIYAEIIEAAMAEIEKQRIKNLTERMFKDIEIRIEF